MLRRGKGLGQAFASLGKSILESGKTAVDKVSDWADKKKEDEKEEPEA